MAIYYYCTYIVDGIEVDDTGYIQPKRAKSLSFSNQIPKDWKNSTFTD